MKKFKKKFLSEVLQLKDEEVKLVMEAQNKFPELLLNDGKEINSAKKLYEELGMNISHWKRWYNKNIFSNEFFTEGKDWQGFTLMANGNETMDFKVTVDFAKHLSMQGKSLSSHKIRSYFILMEKSIKGIEGHLLIREPEKQGFNEMKQNIREWCIRNNYDSTMDIFYSREADMLNANLMGKKASELKIHIGFKGRETREHLPIDNNKALYELQMLNSSLLLANLNFETRSNIIKTTCENKYSDLYINNIKEVS